MDNTQASKSVSLCEHFAQTTVTAVERLQAAITAAEDPCAPALKSARTLRTRAQTLREQLAKLQEESRAALAHVEALAVQFEAQAAADPMAQAKHYNFKI